MSQRAENIEIREITPADAAAAAGLSTELGYPVDTPTMRARIEHLGGLSDHGVFVACRADQAVGWVHVSAAHHLQSEPRAEIGGLIVSERARSGRIGARLVARAEQWARDSGLATVVVRSQVMREAAHRFYTREGYTRTKTSAVFTKSL